MSSAERFGLVNGIPGPDFLAVLVDDHSRNLARFLDAETGAVREGTRDDGRPPFLFSEVTGYAIRDLLLLYAIKGEAEYLTRAFQAADWLVRTAADERGWVRTRYYFEHDADEARRLDSFAGGNIFSFDNGICLGGLVALYMAVKMEAARDGKLAGRVRELLGRIRVLAENIVGRVAEDGSLPAICDAQGVEVQCAEPRWSQRRGSFHAKVAEALAELYAVTGEGVYAETARRICRFALTFQQEDGRFVTDGAGGTQLHPHCYSAEGLLRVGTILKEPEFVDSARRATEWALGRCRGGRIAQETCAGAGGAPSWRTDALAQVLGLAARLLQSDTLDEKHWKVVRELAGGVLAMKHPDERHFRYGYYEDGAEAHTLSYWTNMFAFHSLLEYAAAWTGTHLSVILLAGGIGSRCWPISCVDLPKPLSRGLLGDRSLLEATVTRFLGTGCVRPRNIFVLSTRSGVEKARAQMRPFGIPPENVISELQPKGTLVALQNAWECVGERLTVTVAISTSDDLIEPQPVFRHALLNAAQFARWEQAGVITSLGLPGRGCDPRFGHAIFKADGEAAPGVYRVKRFVEKPQDSASLRLSEGETFAWDSGCIIAQRDYMGGILAELAGDGTTPGALEGDMTRRILENLNYKKAVALYSPLVRFLDVGAPGNDWREFFSGTEADRGNGNILLGPPNVEVTFVEASGNIIISDGMVVEVTGIKDHLIIDNSHTNSAVVLPLDKVDALPVAYRMLKDVDGFHPYIVGGEITLQASPHNLAHDCRGQCQTDSSHGLAVAINCTNLRLQRSAERLQVADQGPDGLLPLSKELAKPHRLPHLARELLRLLALAQDLEAGIPDGAAETGRGASNGNHAKPNWATPGAHVLDRLIYATAGGELGLQQQELSETFNDGVNPAVEM